MSAAATSPAPLSVGIFTCHDLARGLIGASYPFRDSPDVVRRSSELSRVVLRRVVDRLVEQAAGIWESTSGAKPAIVTMAPRAAGLHLKTVAADPHRRSDTALRDRSSPGAPFSRLDVFWHDPVMCGSKANIPPSLGGIPAAAQLTKPSSPSEDLNILDEGCGAAFVDTIVSTCLILDVAVVLVPRDAMAPGNSGSASWSLVTPIIMSLSAMLQRSRSFRLHFIEVDMDPRADPYDSERPPFKSASNVLDVMSQWATRPNFVFDKVLLNLSARIARFPALPPPYVLPTPTASPLSLGAAAAANSEKPVDPPKLPRVSSIAAAAKIQEKSIDLSAHESALVTAAEYVGDRVAFELLRWQGDPLECLAERMSGTKEARAAVAAHAAKQVESAKRVQAPGYVDDVDPVFDRRGMLSGEDGALDFFRHHLQLPSLADGHTKKSAQTTGGAADVEQPTEGGNLIALAAATRRAGVCTAASRSDPAVFPLRLVLLKTATLTGRPPKQQANNDKAGPEAKNSSDPGGESGNTAAAPVAAADAAAAAPANGPSSPPSATKKSPKGTMLFWFYVLQGTVRRGDALMFAADPYRTQSVATGLRRFPNASDVPSSADAIGDDNRNAVADIDVEFAGAGEIVVVRLEAHDDAADHDATKRGLASVATFDIAGLASLEDFPVVADLLDVRIQGSIRRLNALKRHVVVIGYGGVSHGSVVSFASSAPSGPQAAHYAVIKFADQLSHLVPIGPRGKHVAYPVPWAQVLHGLGWPTEVDSTGSEGSDSAKKRPVQTWGVYTRFVGTPPGTSYGTSLIQSADLSLEPMRILAVLAKAPAALRNSLMPTVDHRQRFWREYFVFKREYVPNVKGTTAQRVYPAPTDEELMSGGDLEHIIGIAKVKAPPLAPRIVPPAALEFSKIDDSVKPAEIQRYHHERATEIVAMIYEKPVDMHRIFAGLPPTVLGLIRVALGVEVYRTAADDFLWLYEYRGPENPSSALHNERKSLHREAKTHPHTAGGHISFLLGTVRDRAAAQAMDQLLSMSRYKTQVSTYTSRVLISLVASGDHVGSLCYVSMFPKLRTEAETFTVMARHNTPQAGRAMWILAKRSWALMPHLAVGPIRTHGAVHKWLRDKLEALQVVTGERDEASMAVLALFEVLSEALVAACRRKMRAADATGTRSNVEVTAPLSIAYRIALFCLKRK